MLDDLLSIKALLALEGFYFFEFWSNGSLSWEGHVHTIMTRVQGDFFSICLANYGVVFGC